MAKLPKWLDSNRKEYLLKLWLAIGNKCLLGHDNCQDITHYALPVAKYHKVSIPCKQLISDKQGNIKEISGYTVKIAETTEYKPLNLYDYLANEVIAEWKASDRELDKINKAEEYRNLHRLPTRNRNNCEFNADAFYDSQPLYYYEGLGISIMTFQPFAKIRVSSSYNCLFVDLPKQAFKGLSKNKKRKCIRYGKPLPTKADAIISLSCIQAVKSYLNF